MIWINEAAAECPWVEIRRLLRDYFRATRSAMEPSQVRLAIDLCGFLFIGSGILALLDAIFVRTLADRASIAAVGVLDVCLGILLPRFPWERWPRRAPLALVPFVLAIVVASDVFSGSSPYFYPIFYVLTFCWIGMAQPPGTALMMAPVAAIAYLVPFTFPGHPPGMWTVTPVVGVCVLVGEAVAWLLYQTRQARLAEQEALAHARDEAIEAARVKSEFLAVMSHELRTPLNGVLGALNLAEDSGSYPEMVRIARTSAEALLGIINDVLDFSRLEAGALRVESVPFDLGRVTSDVVSLMDVLASPKGLRIAVDYPAELPRRFIGDCGRLRQVLLNLVGNAVKFSESGQILVRVRDGVRIEVEDTGPGIPPEQMVSVFERFTQLDASSSRRYGGSGLGLAISKRLVELMGGTIGVASEVGRGSLFWFVVPLERDASPPPPPSPAPSRPRLQMGEARILVVDDNEINLRLAQAQVQLLGHRVELAANGREAVSLVETGTYDAILMDCQMPEMDGFEATAEIRRRGHRTPIIAMTAGVLQSDRDRCQEAGMDDFLAKPVKRADLEAMLARWLGP